MTRRRHRDERGQTAIEIVGMLVVVAAVVGALVSSDVGSKLGARARAVICQITRTACGGDSGGGQESAAPGTRNDAKADQLAALEAKIPFSDRPYGWHEFDLDFRIKWAKFVVNNLEERSYQKYEVSRLQQEVERNNKGRQYCNEDPLANVTVTCNGWAGFSPGTGMIGDTIFPGLQIEPLRSDRAVDGAFDSPDTARALERAGIDGDGRSGRQWITHHLYNTYGDASSVVKELPDGRLVRHSVIEGPDGKVKLETIWDGRTVLSISVR